MAAKQKKAKNFVKRKGPAAALSSSFSAAAAAKRARARAPESVANAKGKGNGKGKGGGDSSLFESRWTKRKFDVIGKKRKGEGRRVGLSRSAAIEKRKKTILQEFKSRGKANVFLDHRFGEDDECLAEEDKAILRFQRERQVQWQKRSKFTLPDEEDEETVLTHGGKALSNLDDFEDGLFEEDDKELDEELVREFHFGGESANGHVHGDQNEKKPKSKKEIMEEIIAKSKFYKAQKAKEREEDAELKDRLDQEFAALAQSQALISLVRPKKVNALKAMAGKNSFLKGTPDVAGEASHEKPDEFDKLVKEMGMEMRAHASDRLKTDEEIAEEEKARLEELEEKRKKRMLGEVGSEDSDLEETDPAQVPREAKWKRSQVSGDDLGENFLMSDDQPKKGWVDEVLARNNDEEEDSTNEEDDDTSMDEDCISGQSSGDDGENGDLSNSDREVSEERGLDASWEESNEDNMINSSGNSLSQNLVKGVEGKKRDVESLVEAARDFKHSSSGSQLPFVIEAPKSLEELKSLVDNRSIDDLLVAIQRIRTCNSIRLAAENRRKMQVFYGILLQYFASVAGGKSPVLDRLNALVKPLIEMTSETPYFAAVCARERIVRMHEKLSEKLRNPGVDGPWPSLRCLVLLRLWSMIFPPSDFRHVVMTPSILLMAEYLTRCPVSLARDLAVGTFICALLLSIMRPARRLCPEALSFLYAALVSALPQKNGPSEIVNCHGCGAFMLELVASQPWLHLQSNCSTSSYIEDLEFNHIMTADRDAPFFGTDRFRISVLNSVLGTLEGFSHIYEDVSCYPELFGPFVAVFQDLSVNRFFPQAIHASLVRLLGQMKENISKHERLRQPLRMRVKKPAPIKQFNPKFEENFVRGRNYDPDRERSEGKKLQRLLKQEAKGAVRELRKDNYFLQAEKAKEKALVEEQREEKYRKAMAFLQDQEASFKSGQLGKGRSRKR